MRQDGARHPPDALSYGSVSLSPQLATGGHLLMWDNKCTMHRAVPCDDRNERFHMCRNIIIESGS
jgi:hypothetical protein